MTTLFKIQPVIMSGGSGTRLWPMSRIIKPKQFLPLVTDETLFQETALRLQDENYSPPVVICGESHIPLVETQLAALNITPAAIITEPMPRNTAAVAAVASAWTQKHNKGALVLLTPADHHIANPAGFRASVSLGAPAAQTGSIVTFGIHPTEPHTGFGYIENSTEISPSVFRVSAFKEKPDHKTAQTYIKSGNYHWNAGIFLFGADAMMTELTGYAEDIAKHASNALNTSRSSGNVITLNREAFSQCPSDSIDYAVMEQTAHAAVVAPVDVGWNDIGSWTAIETDTDRSQISTIDCTNTTIRTSGPMVAAIGVKDMIVVATDDAVLIAPKARAQDVKSIISDLKSRERDDLL